MSFIHHPAFQSVALPLLLTLVLTGLLGGLQAPARNRWWAMGAAIALLLSYVLLPGYDWPATARAHKLPWIVLGGTSLAAAWLLFGTSRPNRWTPWAMSSALWATACVWLMGNAAQWIHSTLGTLAGAAVLALLLITKPGASLNPHGHAGASSLTTASIHGIATAGALTVAALGLAAVAAGSGSLLQAQLAMMLAVVTAVPGLWAWLRSASGLTIAPAALLPLGLSWLAIAYAMAVPGPSESGRVAIMALAFAAPALVNRSSLAARRPRWAPLVAALLAAVPVLVSLAWLLLGDAAASGGAGFSSDAEGDLYYQPTWQ
ncbi:hypothetical protein [Hydrogenophaga sp.]|uniref:hypothetical protein n=1 Tax=Hydrogenophaga sp. TaxID=1904254 RepID=UPI002728204B|nr:hypothetical protein [Hydrogenophaga sp.]MDO8904500.1 hypothetical protein [Hydrogenophaga sp.]